MNAYVIRIFKADNRLALTINGVYLSDFFAIRSAQKLLKNGQFAQVWRGDECIYDDQSRRSSIPLSAA